MTGANCHNEMNAQQDHRFFREYDPGRSPITKVGLHIVRNEDMEAFHMGDDENDDAHEEFLGNTVHFIA